MSLPQITIDDRPLLHKIARYNPNLIPVFISVTSENFVNVLTTPSDFAQLFILPYYFPNPTHAIIKDETYCCRVIRCYFSRKQD